MRSLLALTLATCMALTVVWGQQTGTPLTSRTELLAQLRSDGAEIRSRAFKQLRADAASLRDPKVKIALIGLLERENHEPIFGEEEDYADYTSWLTATVAKLVNWEDTHQVCILANSVDIPDELADHAKVAIPCLLQRLNNSTASSRGTATAMLVQASAKGRSELDAATVQTVQQVILNALRDSNAEIKIPTIKALEQFGGKDMIPALSVVAEKDPDPTENYAIQKWAAEAIAAIQKREGQKQQ
jgi:hypothetical protein